MLFSGHSSVLSFLLERNNDTVTLMYKYNCSDLHWIGDEHSQAFTLILRQLQFDISKIEPCVPKTMPDEILTQMDLNIDASSSRIRLQEDKDKAEEDIESLRNELDHLKNPEATPFHWDLTIYGPNSQLVYSSDESENYENAELSEEDASENQSIEDGRNKRGRISIDFNVGKKKSKSQNGPIEYNVDDFVILMSGLF